MRADWLGDVLRGAGVPVVELAGARTRGSLLGVVRAVVWHHDASAAGPSPGVAEYLRRQLDAGKPSAQLWVDTAGAWHVIGTGYASHAGACLPGKPSNVNSLGIETDHTTGEQWPAAQLDSLRRGTAAILSRIGVTAGNGGLEFHRSICKPPGRKVDPDGLDLTGERLMVDALMVGRRPISSSTSSSERNGQPAPAATPAFPLPAGWYYGPRSGPRESVSGFHGRGEGLRAWQARMAWRGADLAVDGLYGPQTARAARDLQAARGLVVDALIGPRTWAAAWGP